MKFDAENQHAEAFKCRGFDGFYNLGGDEAAAAPVDGETTTKLGGLVAKGSDFAKSEKGQAAIAGAKNLFQVGKNISARRNPDAEVLEKCGKKTACWKKEKRRLGKMSSRNISSKKRSTNS